MAGSRRSPFRFAYVLLDVLVVGCVLAWGGVPPWVLWGALPLAVAALLLATTHKDTLDVPYVAWVPLAGAVISLFQVVPLPPSLLDVVSPPAAGLRDFTVVPLGLSSWRPVSADPPATWLSVAKHVFGFFVLCTAYQFASSSRSSDKHRVLRTVALTGGGLVLFGALHALLGFDKLFGVFGFSNAAPRLLTPFGNGNHMAGFLVLAGTLALTFALHVEQRLGRAGWLAVFGACAMGVLVTLSRAGIVVFALAAVAVLLTTVWQRLRTPREERRSAEVKVPDRLLGALLTAVLAGAVGVGLWYETLTERFGDAVSAFTKLTLWPRALEAAMDYARAGMGRGAFEVGFTRFAGHHAGRTFTHPENWLLQWLVEYGVPFTALLLAAAGFLGYRLAKGLKHSAFALSVGIAALAVVVHNLADFNLEFLGVGTAWFAVVGVAAASTATRWEIKIPRVPVVGVASALAVVGCWVAWPALSAVDATLREAKVQASRPSDVRTAALREIDRRPADYWPYALVAASYASAVPFDAAQALAFANRALYLYPIETESHRVAARALLRMGHPAQSRLEYRLAYANAPDGGALLAEAIRTAKGADALFDLVPRNVPAVMALVNALSGSKRNIEAAEVLVKAVSDFEDRSDIGALALRGVTMLTELERWEDAQALLEVTVPELGQSPEWSLARAELHTRQGQTAEARAVLAAALEKHPGHVALTRALFQALVDAKEYAEARKSLHGAQAVALERSLRSELLSLEASSYRSEGLLERALAVYRSASQVAPSSMSYAQEASVLEKLKRYADAVSALRAAKAVDRGNPAAYWDEQIERLRNQALVEREALLKSNKGEAGGTP